LVTVFIGDKSVCFSAGRVQLKTRHLQVHLQVASLRLATSSTRLIRLSWCLIWCVLF